MNRTFLTIVELQHPNIAIFQPFTSHKIKKEITNFEDVIIGQKGFLRGCLNGMFYFESVNEDN